MQCLIHIAASHAAACALFIGAPALAQTGNLSLSHQRVVFEGNDRTAIIHVLNRGDVPETYRVDLIEMEMEPSGAIRPVDLQSKQPQTSAREFIDFTPRRITLDPRQSQAIRIRMRSPGNQGERRSHLAITVQPSENAGLTAAQLVAGSEQTVAVQVSTLFSVSIPIIVRSDVKAAGARLENVRAAEAPKDGPPMISFDLVREGAGSVYGDVEVIANRGRDKQVLACIRGIAVYPEIERRAVQVALPKTASGQSVRLVYHDRGSSAPTQLAALALIVP